MTIPRVDTRLESFFVRQTFKVKITAVQESVVSIGLAIEETKRSKRFQRSLEIVLAIGNYLNGNTFRGGAYGFKLDALLKLAEIRVSNGKETVMNYIAELSETKYKDIAGMIEDFPHLEGSSKEPLNQVNADLSQIKKGMALVEKEIGQFSPDSTDKLKQLLVSFYDIASVELEHTQTKLQATDKQFKELLAMFGEDDTTDSQTFFAIVWRFVNGIEKAKEDNARRKALAEKAAQAAIVAEKKKIELAEKRKTTSQMGDALSTSSTTLNQKDILDQQLAKMRAGAFGKRGQSRKQIEKPVEKDDVANEALLMFERINKKKEGPQS